MNIRALGVLIIAVCIAAPLPAAQQATGDDGRQVVLNKDGSWEYSSADRFATTSDGKRVRLKADGNWEYTGDVASEAQHRPPALAADKQFIDAQSLELTLADLVIETIRGKKSQAHKNTRKKTQSVFYIDIAADPTAADTVTLPLKAADFSVDDTDGRSYAVLSVAPALLMLEPGDEATVVIRADGSPHWWTTKSMSVTLDKTVFAGRKDIVLTRAMSNAKNKRVEVFE